MLHLLQKPKQKREMHFRCSELHFESFERERVLLSRISGDPTVDGLQDEKEKRSTRRGLRVGTRFWEFLQTP